jgi:hypothetical protein
MYVHIVIFLFAHGITLFEQLEDFLCLVTLVKTYTR